MTKIKELPTKLRSDRTLEEQPIIVFDKTINKYYKVDDIYFHSGQLILSFKEEATPFKEEGYIEYLKATEPKEYKPEPPKSERIKEGGLSRKKKPKKVEKGSPGRCGGPNFFSPELEISVVIITVLAVFTLIYYLVRT